MKARGWRLTRRTCALLALVTVGAWIVGGFAYGFGWTPPADWRMSALTLASYCVVAVGGLAWPLTRLIEMETER